MEAEKTLLAGSWVLISRVRSRVTMLITFFRVPTSLLVRTQKSPSRPWAVFEKKAAG